jgi:hypothetical protein
LLAEEVRRPAYSADLRARLPNHGFVRLAIEQVNQSTVPDRGLIALQ